MKAAATGECAVADRRMSFGMDGFGSCRLQLDGPLQIEDGKNCEQVCGVSSERVASCSRPAVEALHLAEDAFDRRPVSGDEIVAKLLAWRERRLALVAALGDAVLDTGLLQSRMASLLGVSLIAIDRSFVPRDELIGMKMASDTR